MMYRYTRRCQVWRILIIVFIVALCNLLLYDFKSVWFNVSKDQVDQLLNAKSDDAQDEGTTPSYMSVLMQPVNSSFFKDKEQMQDSNGDIQAKANEEQPKEDILLNTHHQSTPNKRTMVQQGQKLKTILYWNKFFKSNEFKFGLGQEPFLQHKCKVNTCTATNDKLLLDEIDAVVFHGPQIDELPINRKSNQIYVYVQKEPWMDMSDRLLSKFENTMNLTMTYRTDSDIHIPYAWVYRNESRAEDKQLAMDSVKKKMKSVAWAVSHCETDSQREVYVKQLQQYIDVDIYGKCGDLKCDKKHNGACWEKFQNEYYFMLALENDYCNQYVSEKAYRPFKYNIVPIVFGGVDYSLVTPPHSVINIKDYPNPKDLARYLKSLIKNRSEYMRYLAWKWTGYEIESYRRTIIGHGFCELCDILHDEEYKYKDYSDLRKWWVDGQCDRQIMDTFRKTW